MANTTKRGKGARASSRSPKKHARKSAKRKPNQSDPSAQGITIRDQLANLARMFPKRAGKHLYANVSARDKPTRGATLYVYIRSTDRTYALHESLFVRKRAFDRQEWKGFMDGRVFKGWKNDGTPSERSGILVGAIIPGINIRTQGKLWSVVAVIGYVTHDLRQPPPASLVGRRRKTKSSGEQDG